MFGVLLPLEECSEDNACCMQIPIMIISAAAQVLEEVGKTRLSIRHVLLGHISMHVCSVL